LEPRNGIALANIGADLNDLGRVDEAMPYLKKAAALLPKDPVVHNNIGGAYRALGHGAVARAAYERALACPVIMASVDEIAAVRTRTVQEISEHAARPGCATRRRKWE